MIREAAPQAAPLASGTAFVDLSTWRMASVAGSDARTWMNDLVSADLSGLRSGQARQSLLLSPTGRIRAAFTVACVVDELLLIQDPGQPKAIAELLTPYVLSSDVSIEDRAGRLSLFSFPGRTDLPSIVGAMPSAPSCLGAGADLFVPAADRDRALADLQETSTLASEADMEAWRITAGLPRFGVDVLEDDLPQEGGLAGAVSFGKGCYLGQEAVAKVQNLGHPRRLVIPLGARGPVAIGETVLANGSEAGSVTSVAAGADGWFVLARVRWEARSESMTTKSGQVLGARRTGD